MQCQTNDDIELDVIEPPVVPSQLEFIETAEPEVVIVQISSSHCVQEEQAGPSHHLQVVAATSVDLGIVVQAAQGCWATLRRLVSELSDAQKMQHHSCHTKPATDAALHSHSVTKCGKTWKVIFQHRWMDQFPCLSYSSILEWGICKHCILFPEQPKRGGSQGAIPGVLVLSVYQSPYNKALGKDGILVCHEKSTMHCHATNQADLFLLSVRNPDSQIDVRSMAQSDQQVKKNTQILQQIVIAFEFLAKQGLALRGHRDDKVDLDMNRGNFIATLQLMAKENSVQKHLSSAKRNSKYTSKTIQNDIIHVYAMKIKEKLTEELRSQNLPFTIIADECTDSHSNQEILSVCVRFVNLSTPNHPHIKECLVDFIHLERATAAVIASKILESLTNVSLSLNPSNIRGQAYDGAAVMSSE